MAEDNNQTPHYAGFWLRVVASIIDTIVASIVLSMVGAILFSGTEPRVIDIEAILGQPSAAAMLQALALQLPWQQITWQNLVTAVLVVSFWMLFAATPGKMLFRAHIVDARTLRRASQGQLVIRYLGYFVSMLPLMLGFLWVAFDPRKQGWHDKLAGTVVIIGQPRSGADDEATNSL